MTVMFVFSAVGSVISSGISAQKQRTNICNLQQDTLNKISDLNAVKENFINNIIEVDNFYVQQYQSLIDDISNNNSILVAKRKVFSQLYQIMQFILLMIFLAISGLFFLKFKHKF